MPIIYVKSYKVRKGASRIVSIFVGIGIAFSQKGALAVQ